MAKEEELFKVEGWGHQSKFAKGEPGDLYVRLNIENSHEMWRDKENNVHTKVHLNLGTAMLGCSRSIQTLWEEREIQLREATQHGDWIRLKSEGILEIDSGIFSDHIIEVDVSMPTKVNPIVEKIFKEFGEEDDQTLNTLDENVQFVATKQERGRFSSLFNW